MNIKEIYKQLVTPPNLQKHMMLVAHVGVFLCDHWTGENLQKEHILQAALLHDVGNIVRFAFDDPATLIEGKDIAYWKQLQKDVIAKYGADDHDATEKMLSEVGVEETIIQTILEKSFANSVKTQTAG